MRPVSDLRCPSSRCLESFRIAGPISLQGQFQHLPRPSWPKWFEEIICYKESNPDHLVDPVYECPACQVVWTQPSSFDAGFHAVLWGYNRGDTERLEPVPVGVQATDPTVRRVAEAPSKRGGG